MKNKEYLLDIIVITIMTVFLVILSEMGWLRKYAHFTMIPFLVIYFVGEYLGNKFAKKRLGQ